MSTASPTLEAPSRSRRRRGRHLRGGNRQLITTALADLPMVIILLVALVLLWPATLGGNFGMVIVAGPSMEPTYSLGDLVVTWKTEPHVGDVVTYRIPEGNPAAGQLVIHRIVGGDPSGWVTQGDNAAEPDLWQPSNDDILGETILHLPGVGTVFNALRSPLAVAVAGGLLAVVLLWPKGRTLDD